MQLDVQWFLKTLVDNSIMTVERGIQINNALGGEPDLMQYAQEVLNELCTGMSPEDARNWASQLEQVIAFAQQQAATGQAPDLGTAPDAAQSAGPRAVAGEDGVSAEIPNLRNVSQMTDEEVADTMRQLLLALRVYGASDLHLSSNAPAFIRKNLLLERLDPEWVMPDADVVRLNMALLTEEQREQFRRSQDMNIGLQIGKARFRTALMFHKDGMSGAYRLVPDRIMTLEELGFLPADAKNIRRLLDYNNGLILVTGPLGSGKTTTLASMIEVANNTREDHVITVEDPIEIVQKSKGCQITQREIGTCTKSYHAALKGALREDPDIIVIGEMHDLETIENAITASETGHLVIGTLHTCDAGNTLNRVLDVFPPAQQPQIRAMTAGSLRGIICQRLVPAANGGLTIAYELLINTVAVANLISEGKLYQLKATMQIGSKAGMCTIDQNLFEKFKAGHITAETALAYMRDASVIDQIKKYVAVEEAKKLVAAKTAAKKKK